MFNLCFVGFGASFETAYTRNQTVIVGDDIELECSLNPSQDHNLLWEHRPVYERLLKTVIAGNYPNAEYASRFSVSSTARKYNLFIKNVHVQDAGMYLCNDQDEIERRSDTNIELIVLGMCEVSCGVGISEFRLLLVEIAVLIE